MDQPEDDLTALADIDGIDEDDAFAIPNFNADVMAHLGFSVEKVKSIFVMAATRIEGLKSGEKIPATALAAEIADHPTVNSTGAYLYPILKLFINDKYPGVKIMRGAHGGIQKL